MHMTITRIALAVCLLTATQAVAQPVPSHTTPYTTHCRAFDSGSPLQANINHHLLLRGSCNIPQEANAVVVSLIAVNPGGNGHGTLWPSSHTQPEASTWNFRTGPGSSNASALVALCQEVDPGECSEADVVLRITQAARVIIDVQGFLVPSQP